MPAAWRTVRVFISSTFKDMQAERDHLVRFVFPRLREELLRRRMHFVDVDLRWGVTSEQDAQQVCREIIDECRPRFLCMLGGRYGWTPPGRDRSITADEVHYAALDRGEPDRHHFFYFRDPAATSAMVEHHAGEYREPPGSENELRLEELKQTIQGAGYEPFVYPAQWNVGQGRLVGFEEFGRRVYDELLASINEEFGTEAPEAVDEFAEEMARQEAFVSERTARYVVGSRQPVLDRVAEIASSDGEPSILAVTGPPGSGKSALLGKAYQDLAAAYPDWLVVPHFVGASAGSTDLRRSLRRLCHELQGAGDDPIPDDVEELITRLPTLLEQAGSTRRVVLVIDALNQMDPTDGAHTLRWLPHRLPQNVRIVVSSLAHPVLETLRRRREQVVELELAPLTSGDARAIVEGFTARYHKRLSEEQLEALLSKPEGGSPLYLLVALEELRTLGTYEEITARIEQLPGSVRDLFLWILQERLSADPGFQDPQGNLVGGELVCSFVSRLGVSRHGLSHAELVGTVDPDDRRGNVAALERLLRPYLMRRGGLFDFYHGQLRGAVEAAYLGEEHEQLDAHRSLASYFSRQGYGNRRTLAELPHHQTHAGLERELEATLSDLGFLDAKCKAGMLFDAIRDCHVAAERFNLPSFTQLQNALRLAAPSIQVSAEVSGPAIFNRLRWLDSPVPRLAEAFEPMAAYLDARGPWLRAEGPLPEPRDGRGVIPLAFPAPMQAVSPNGRLLAAVSHEGVLEVRDIASGECVDKRRLNARGMLAMALRDEVESLAWLKSDGSVHGLSEKFPHSVRKGETQLGCHPTLGVLAIRDDHALLAWSLPRDEGVVLAGDVPAPLRALCIALGAGQLAYVAGEAPQEIGVVSATASGWNVRRISHQGPRIIDAGIDADGKLLLLACRDRHLRILDLDEGVVRAELAYERHPEITVQGAPLRCALGLAGSAGKAFLATDFGQIACWSWQDGTLERWEDYRSLGECTQLVLLEVLPPDGRLLVSTDRLARVFAASGRSEIVKHPVAVGSVALTASGRLVSACREDKTVRWFSGENLALLDVVALPACTPTALAPSGEGDSILLGTQEGLILRLEPTGKNAQPQLLGECRSPIVSLFNVDGRHVFAATRNGTIFRIGQRARSAQIVRRGTGFLIQKKILPGGDKCLCWSIHQDAQEQGRAGLVITAVRDVDEEEPVFSVPGDLYDVAVAPDGGCLCLAGDDVTALQPSDRRWEPAWVRSVPARRVAFLHGGRLLAVARADSSWLEVWATHDGRAVGASIDLPSEAACLAGRGNGIAVGLRSGALMSLAFRGASLVDNPLS